MNPMRRYLQYIAGITVMALGVVLIKKAEIGISPLSAIPAALSNITPYSLGGTTIAFHVACVAATIVIMRKVTLKTILILPLALVMGVLINGFMRLFCIESPALWLRGPLCAGGIVLTAVGIVAITGTDLMLPAPDALLRQISLQIGKPLSTVKIIGDIAWVVITLAIELAAMGKVVSVGIGTLASMLLTGWFVGLFSRWLSFPRSKKDEKAV